MKKKLTVTLLSLILLLNSAGVFVREVKAEEYNTVQDEYGYNYSCGSSFEVDEIRDDGNFEVKGCYLSLNDAKTKMKENEDYVVRYASGRSPMKIVAMNGGLVYGYPERKNKSTLHIYENEDETGLITYTGSYYEMVYEDTNVVVASGQYAGYGILHVNLNGFDGYTDLELVDLIPFKFIDKEIPCYTGVNSSKAKKFIIRQNYFVARENGNYKDLMFNYAISVKHPTANDAKQSGEMTIGQAPDEMELNRYYYSKDGVTFYSDSHYQNYAFTNYNYFQWLSLRSEASLTKDQLNGYLAKMKKTGSSFYGDNAQAFIDAQNTYGMNALLVFGLACNESNYGTDMIKKNNIFGLGAYDGSELENAFEFDSIADCINDFEGWHLAKYCDYYYVSNGGYHYYTAPYFGNKGVGVSVRYMSDPYECYKVASIAYNFDKYINNYDGTYTNNNAYNLALVNENGVDFKVLPDNSSKTLYKSYAGYYTTYQKDCIATVLGQEDNYAKVVSSNPIDENGNVVLTTGMTTYDHSRSVAYVSLNSLTALNNKNMFTDPIGEYSLNITDLSWNENLLSINGTICTENLNKNASVSLKLADGISFDIKKSQSEDTVIVEKSVDIADLDTGIYTLSIKTDYTDASEYSRSDVFTVENLPAKKVMNDKTYEFIKQNGSIVLTVIQTYSGNPDHYDSLIVAKNIELKKNEVNNHVELTVKGIAIIKGVDSSVPGQTLHNLVLVNLLDGSETRIELDNTSSIFSINDGHVYSEAGFEKTIDINTYSLGSYGLKIETIIGEISSIDDLRSANSAFANLNVLSEDDKSYRISLNDYELNRVELDIENHFTEIDYSLINKVEERSSLTNVTKIEFANDKLTINLAAMIYYLDYDNPENLTYNVYLVNDTDSSIIKMDTRFIQNKYDYKKNFRSSFNMDNISISATKDLEDIQKGEYRIVVEIINETNEATYHDYVNLIDSFNIQRDSAELNNLAYSFYVSNIRDRMILKVVDK